MHECVGAGKSERTGTRRALVMRVGKIKLHVPQDRQGRFCTELFERYQRSEKAVMAALVEIYVQGVSTWKVKAITGELCGHEFSSSTIRRSRKTSRSSPRGNSTNSIAIWCWTPARRRCAKTA